MNLFDLTMKKALVTGGRNGLLGPIWVECLKEAGAEVDIFDLPENDVKNPIFRNLDYDILINNAAVDNPPGSEASFFGNFDEIMSVNINGAVNMCREIIPGMIKRGGGVIVNIGSIMGYGGADWTNYEGAFEKPFGYNASKWALRGLAKSITTQYGRYNIRSVTISFGPYSGGKLERKFLLRFLRRVPLCKTISKESFKMTLLYACSCPELAGVDWRIDAGLGAWA